MFLTAEILEKKSSTVLVGVGMTNGEITSTGLDKDL